ncbi:Riboflavin transporter [Defluviimonas aquaemixtae]|uniref:Riboflavin transporter n=2 Tax=Albidovulum aquaemixtae TaxID=1542388 RepID=A0A2R8B2G4_9RHOB|nr:Riboflavin transporter [Defluviimonas aquaemixtae]
MQSAGTLPNLARMRPDRPLLGILMMLGFCLFAPLGDALAKILGPRVPLLELVTARFAIQAAVLTPLLLATGGTLRMGARAFRLTLVRTALHIAGISAMFLALRHLPLADAVAIAFVMPFIMLLLGRFILNEEVGPHRLAACAVGFAGTLLVIQPNFSEVGAPALLPLLVAVIFAFFMLVTRQIARDTDAVTLQAVSGLAASAVLVPALALAEGTAIPELDPILPGRTDAALLLALGLLGTIAHLLMTGALRHAPTSTLAPMQYLEIPLATIVGLIIFGHLPNGLAALGIAVTIAAGLYVIARERRIARLGAA